MTHPEAYFIDAYSMPVLFGGLFVMCLCFLIYRSVANLIASRLAETTKKFISSDEARFVIGICLLVPSVVIYFAMPYLLTTTAIISTYGWDGYRNGIETVNRFGLLSNGDFLPVYWQIARGSLETPLQYLVAIPFIDWLMRSKSTEPLDEGQAEIQTKR